MTRVAKITMVDLSNCIVSVIDRGKSTSLIEVPVEGNAMELPGGKT